MKYVLALLSAFLTLPALAQEDNSAIWQGVMIFWAPVPCEGYGDRCSFIRVDQTPRTLSACLSGGEVKQEAAALLGLETSQVNCVPRTLCSAAKEVGLQEGMVLEDTRLNALFGWEICPP